MTLEHGVRAVLEVGVKAVLSEFYRRWLQPWVFSFLTSDMRPTFMTFFSVYGAGLNVCFESRRNDPIRGRLFDSLRRFHDSLDWRCWRCFPLVRGRCVSEVDWHLSGVICLSDSVMNHGRYVCADDSRSSLWGRFTLVGQAMARAMAMR